MFGFIFLFFFRSDLKNILPIHLQLILGIKAKVFWVHIVSSLQDHYISLIILEYKLRKLT